MRKIITLIFIISLFSQSLIAQQDTTIVQQDTSWRKGGTFGLNFNQTSLTNWAAGGENALALSGMLNLFANYKKNRIAWDNSLDLGYGLLKQGEQDLRKNDDRIDFLTKLGYDITEKNVLFYTALFNFRSQFDYSYNYPNDSTKTLVSKFAAPAYFLLSLGVDYKPNKYFSLFVSPVTAKITMVNDQELADKGAFGGDKAEYDANDIKIKDGEKIRTEIGAYLNTKFQKDILTNVNLMTRLDLFSNYVENPMNLDINWEVLVTMKINKFMVASINTQLIYDDNIDVVQYESVNGYLVPKVVNGDEVAGPRTQFKEVISIGLAYKF